VCLRGKSGFPGPTAIRPGAARCRPLHAPLPLGDAIDGFTDRLDAAEPPIQAPLCAVAGIKVTTDAGGNRTETVVTDVMKHYVFLQATNDRPEFLDPFVTEDGKAQWWVMGNLAAEVGGTRVYALPTRDKDGDGLTFSVSNVSPGASIEINNASFILRARPGFTGIVDFDVTVDDRLGTAGNPRTAADTLSAEATVFVQVGRNFIVPKLFGYRGNAVEKKSYTIPIRRTSMVDETLAPFMVYSITKEPKLGIAQMLCDGKEVGDNVKCARAAEGQPNYAYVIYTPIPDEDGTDTLEITVESASSTEKVTWEFEVQSVNDPPVILSSPVLRAPVLVNPNNVPNDAYADIPINIADISDAEDGTVTVVVNIADSIGLGLQGKFYAGRIPNPKKRANRRSLSQDTVLPSDFSAGSEDYIVDPDTELSLLADADGNVIIPTGPDGAAHVYYQSPVGRPVEESLVYRVTDGTSLSQPATAKITVACTPGTRAVQVTETIGTGASQQTLTLTICEPCPAGTRSITTDTPTCEDCPVGTYSGEGASVCEKCGTGTYNPFVKQTVCLPCPPETRSNEGAGAVSECFCDVGYFGKVTKPVNTPGRPQCQKCTDTGIGGKVLCDNAKQPLPKPEEGYWIDKWATWQSREQVVRSCIPPEACIGGTTISADKVWAEETCRYEEAYGGQGYKGRACSECGDKHFRTGGACATCPNWFVLSLYYVLMGVLMLLPIVVRIWGTEYQKEWAYFHVALVFMQFNGMLQKLRVGYGRYLRNLLQFQSIFMFDVEALHLECVFGHSWATPEAKIRVAYVLPAMALFLSVVGAVLKIFHIRHERKKLEAMRTDPDQRGKYLLMTIQKSKDPRREDYVTNVLENSAEWSELWYPQHFVPLVVGIFMMYVQIMYPGIARAVLSPYDCVPDPLAVSADGYKELFMETAPYIRCSPPSGSGVLSRMGLLWGFGLRGEHDAKWLALREYTYYMLPVIVAGLPLLLFGTWFLGATMGRTNQVPFWRGRRYAEKKREKLRQKYGDKVPYRLWYKAMLGQFSFYYSPSWTFFFVMANFLQAAVLICQTFGNSLSNEGITVQLLGMFFIGVFPYFLLESFSNPFMDHKLHYLQQFFNFTNALSVWNSTALLSANTQVADMVSGVAFVEHILAFGVGILAIWSVAYDYLADYINEIKKQIYFFYAMVQYRARMVKQAQKSIAAQRWAAAISKARFMARMALADREAHAVQLNLKNFVSLEERPDFNIGTNPLSWLYRDTPLAGHESGGGKGSQASGGLSSAFGASSGLPSGLNDGLDGAVDDAFDADGRPLKPSTELADLLFRAFSQVFLLPQVADAAEELLSWAVLKDTWSNYGIMVDKGWVGKAFLKVHKFAQYKDVVDKEAAQRGVTSFEAKLKKLHRGSLLRFLIEREARSDNVELAQVLEMVDDIVGDNLQPDLWNYGEEIRAAATGKARTEEFLKSRDGMNELGDGEEGAEAHQESVDQMQNVLQSYLIQFRARRAQERVLIVEGDLEDEYEVEEEYEIKEGLDLDEIAMAESNADLSEWRSEAQGRGAGGSGSEASGAAGPSRLGRNSAGEGLPTHEQRGSRLGLGSAISGAARAIANSVTGPRKRGQRDQDYG